MEVLIPYSTPAPKSRLSELLSPSERASLASAMLADVVAAVRTAGGDATVLSTAPLAEAIDAQSARSPRVIVDDRPLSTAVNAALSERLSIRGVADGAESAVGIVMADLALATGPVLDEFFTRDGDIVIAPGRGGGTKALVVRHSDFRVDYHGASYLDHRRHARSIDASVSVYDSHRLASDVDRPSDLTEVLVHGAGRAETWLREAGFCLSSDSGRVSVVRE